MASRDRNLRRKVEKVVGKLPPRIHVDHVVPKADGGTDVPQNLQLLPKKVHEMKTAVENVARAKVGRRGRRGRTK
jgi:hypothetical protein